MTRLFPLECVGGPEDGSVVWFRPGQREYCVRVEDGRGTASWHRYHARATDLGLCLLYEGFVQPHTRRQARETAV